MTGLPYWPGESGNAHPVRLRGRRYTLRPMTAAQFLQAQLEAEKLCLQKPETERALCRNAALVAGALYRKKKRLFRDGEMLLKKLRPEEIEELAAAYAQLVGGWDWAEAYSAMEEATFERLKWQVCRAFGTLPTAVEAMKMTDRDYLYCAINLLMDRERGGERVGTQVNPAFDPARFRALKEGKR